MEAGPGYTDDGEGTLVQLHNPAQYTAVPLKVVLPKGVGEHDIGSAVGTTLIGRLEKMAEIGLLP